MLSNEASPQQIPALNFIAAVALRFETPLSVGKTPDGIRFDFRIHGTVNGPALKGKFPPCAAYLLIDTDGVGTINVRAPLALDDGALAELEATGRYDFGEDGYARAAAGDLPNSALGWCPRFFTGHPRYLWLNRTLFLGLGQLIPSQARVDYDLFSMTPQLISAGGARSSYDIGGPAKKGSLYDRLGGKPGVDKVVDAFIDALHDNEQLNRQNPKVAAAQAGINMGDLKKKVADYVCKLTSGPCGYTGRSMKESHANLGISQADWTLAANELVKVLTQFNIQKPEQEELFALIGTTKSDIVTKR